MRILDNTNGFHNQSKNFYQQKNINNTNVLPNKVHWFLTIENSISEKH